MQRPNAVGWGIVLFFLIGGIGFAIAIPGIWIGQIWIVVALGIAVLYFFMSRRADAADELRRIGVPGQARIVEMTQTGTYVNEQPRVRLKLHVEAPGVHAFDVERTYTVPLIALGTLTSGRPLPVYIDRKDHSKFAIDWSGGTIGATIQPEGGAPIDLAANPEVQQAVMQTLEAHGIDPQGSVDLRQKPEVRQAVLDALKRHGIDAAHGVAAATPGTPVEDKGEPLDRVQKLVELKAARLVTEEEFSEQKERILREI